MKIIWEKKWQNGQHNKIIHVKISSYVKNKEVFEVSVNTNLGEGGVILHAPVG